MCVHVLIIATYDSERPTLRTNVYRVSTYYTYWAGAYNRADVDAYTYRKYTVTVHVGRC
jgi:hypothetical protein